MISIDSSSLSAPSISTISSDFSNIKSNDPLTTQSDPPSNEISPDKQLNGEKTSNKILKTNQNNRVSYSHPLSRINQIIGNEKKSIIEWLVKSLSSWNQQNFPFRKFFLPIPEKQLGKLILLDTFKDLILLNNSEDPDVLSDLSSMSYNGPIAVITPDLIESSRRWTEAIKSPSKKIVRIACLDSIYLSVDSITDHFFENYRIVQPSQSSSISPYQYWRDPNNYSILAEEIYRIILSQTSTFRKVIDYQNFREALENLSPDKFFIRPSQYKALVQLLIPMGGNVLDLVVGGGEFFITMIAEERRIGKSIKYLGLLTHELHLRPLWNLAGTFSQKPANQIFQIYSKNQNGLDQFDLVLFNQNDKITQDLLQGILNQVKPGTILVNWIENIPVKSVQESFESILLNDSRVKFRGPIQLDRPVSKSGNSVLLIYQKI